MNRWIPNFSSSRLTAVVLLIVFFFQISVPPVAAAIAYTYDDNGNMTSDGEKCYQYNEANQLKTVRNCNNNKLLADYIYDYNGKRIVKKEYSNGVLKRTVYSPDDGFEKTKLASNSAIQNATYYMANDEVVASKNPDGTKTYYQGDHLGSNAVLTNQGGTVVEKTTYEPYGEVKLGGTKTKFQYTGQEKDSETGLNYYDARFYNSHIQRFIQPDPVLPDIYDPQLLNRYSYVRNNPLKYTDPTGNNPLAIGLLVLLGIVYFGSGGSIYLSSPQVQKNNQKATKTIVSAVRDQVSKAVNNVANAVKQATTQSKPSNTNSKPQNPGNSPKQEPQQEIQRWTKQQDPYKSPGKGWNWEGKTDGKTGKIIPDKGAWVRRYPDGTKESLHPDFKNQTEGPHSDWIPRGLKAKDKLRIKPGGSIIE